jgi:hypothetical protein
VAASAIVPGIISEAEELWYDVNRWPNFVDGFSHVVQRDEAWPGAGVLIWDSTPHGRGRVLERVTRHGVRTGQTAEVEDERIHGIQAVSFEPAGDATRITVSLDYALKEANALSPIVDLLFIRRSVRESLERTVTRFARERRGDAETW